ncbi:MAG: sigma-54-dependent Fis family transcriptional regulator [Acidobacteria bacterium]|nr:sigma-54-dependent Fis family transcriptional regulator [Acidobacteriota bacterium]
MSVRRTKILLVDDDPAMREVLEMRLEGWGFEVRLAADGHEAKERVEADDPDIVLSDVIMPEISGLDLLRSLKAADSQRPVVLITAQGSIDLAVEAMKHGAQDFITKPLDYPKLRAILEAAEKELDLRRKSQRLASQLDSDATFGSLVGRSRPMREVYDLIRSVSATDAGVIITGESGTGKELAARTIHDLSHRSQGPFIAINAAAIPENLIESEVFGHEKGAFTGASGTRMGCFELASRGTLFLDEIAEMPVALQPKLLRVIEGGRMRRLGGSQEIAVDVRVIAATNQSPREAVRSNRLREDLFFRLNVFAVALPPLRERRTDVPLLAQHFIRECNAKHATRVEGVREEPMELLKSYPWPGNVRELRNVIERAVILAKANWIEGSHLPAYVVNPRESLAGKIVLPVGVTFAEAEKELILRTLKSVGNNKAEAARQLGVDVKTIRNKLKSYGMD